MRFITLSLTLIAPGFCLAQAPPAVPGEASPLTANEAVRRAVSQNPRLSAAGFDVATAQAGARAARALTNPSITFTPALTPGGADEELLIQQPLELNGTRSARSGIAQAQLRQTRAQAVLELREVVFQTRQAYYELYRAQELRRVAREALALAEELHRATEQQAEEGIRPGIDRVQTGIEATRGRQQLARAEAQETVARAALNTMMGLGPEAAVGELPALSLGDPPAENDGLIEQALEARAELEVVRGLRDQYRQEARLTRAQGRPDLAPQLRGGSLIRGVQDTGVGLGITWPFLDHGSRRARVRQSEEAANAQGARLQAARNLVRQETVQALARVRATGAVVRDYQGGVLEQSRRVLEARRTGFQAGLTTVLELLEAQRTYRGVLAEYANALADHAEARAELERATGAVPADLLPTPGEKRSPR